MLPLFDGTYRKKPNAERRLSQSNNVSLAGYIQVTPKTHLIPVSANSVMNTPPPAFANAAPYDAVDGSITTQPSLEFVSNEQSVLLTMVEVWTGETWEHPGSVCRVIWFIVT